MYHRTYEPVYSSGRMHEKLKRFHKIYNVQNILKIGMQVYKSFIHIQTENQIKWWNETENR